MNCAPSSSSPSASSDLELVEPGLVPITDWRPEPATADAVVGRVDAYGALGRKP